MSTSGSTNFNQTCNEVCLKALQIIGYHGIGRTASAEDITFARSMLNDMVKGWATDGLHLWAKEEAVLYVTPGTSEYLLGSTAKATLSSDEVLTSLDGAHDSADASLTVDSTAGMTVADVIGVVLSDKTIHWTTIATLPTSTTLTLTSGLSGDASDNALVITYTTALGAPLRVLDARKRTGIGSNIFDLSLSQIGYQDYQMLGAKKSQGSPSQFNYKPDINYGTLYLWSCPSDGAERIQLTIERQLEDLDDATNDFDFPSGWFEPLTWQLAVRLCEPFGKGKRLERILPLASLFYKKLLDWDTEVGVIQFVPDVRDY